jgi:hypothetical protein
MNTAKQIRPQRPNNFSGAGDFSKRRLGYGRKEAAELMGISPVSLDRLVTRGLLRPSRALRRPLFTEENGCSATNFKSAN